MFNRPTVLIIGAGASAEFNMPVGADLMGRIMFSLGSNGELGTQVSLAQRMRDCLGTDRAAELLQLAPRLAAVVSQFVSMDEALHFLSAEPDVVELGKLAISHEIMKAERDSHLYKAMQGNKGRVTASNNSWARLFLRIALSASRRQEIPKLFASVSVIDFNYDRVFPQYLYWALQHNLQIPADVASGCVNGLKVFHPYGSLGQLEWQSAPTYLPFGSDQGSLAEIASRIRTYTEDNSDLGTGQIGAAVQNAKVIIVIGFGFHKQNIDLLSSPLSPVRNAQTFMTVYGINSPNHSVIKSKMQAAFKCEYEPQLFDGIGKNFLHELGLSIGLAAS